MGRRVEVTKRLRLEYRGASKKEKGLFFGVYAAGDQTLFGGLVSCFNGVVVVSYSPALVGA